MADDKGHFGSADLDNLHDSSVQKDTTEGGACLTGHVASFRKFKNKITCNYRYQCYEQAGSESKIKTCLHSYNAKAVKQEVQTSAYETKAGGWAPAYYSLMLPPPRPGDWDVGGPLNPIFRESISKKNVKIPTGMNFTQDTWPYWNNAHHLIPKGLFRSVILELELDVSTLMQTALLKAQYNINHKKNMFMLPQDKEVAKILGLARHLQLKVGDVAGIAASCTDHPSYSDFVQQRLKTIIDSYKQLCDQAISDTQPHDVPKADLDKKKLENLSDTLMNRILDWGESGTGESIDSHAKNEMEEQL